MSAEHWLERGHKVETAIQLLTALFDVLPEPHELAAALANEYARVKKAEGDSPAARRLQRAYMEVEPILASCRSRGISRHAQAVDVAENILIAAAAAHGGDLEVRVQRGDALSPNLLGATISSAFPNGMKFELTLRRTNRDYDAHPDAHPEGHWVLEGYANNSRAPRDAAPTVDLYLGAGLPDNIGRIICACMDRFIAACSASVMRLVISNDA